MQAARGITVRYGFDDAANFASELGRNSRGVHLDRLNVLEIISGGESRRTIVQNGQAVHYILRVVFSTPWVQDTIRLQQPARLRLHHVDGLPSRNGRIPVAQYCLAELIGSPCVDGVEKSVGILNVDGLSDRGDRQSCRKLEWKLGTDLNQRRVWGESGLLQSQLVAAHGQSLGCVFSGRIGLETQLKVVGLADERPMDRQRRAGRIGHVETQFAGAILPRQKLRQGDQKGCKDSSTQEIGLHLFLLDAAGMRSLAVIISGIVNPPRVTSVRRFGLSRQCSWSAKMTQDHPNK